MKTPALEDYMLTLGKMAVFVEMLNNEQMAIVRSGVLNDDEVEQAETIKWECKKLLTILDDQVRLCGERTSKPWDETLKDLQAKLKESINETEES